MSSILLILKQALGIILIIVFFAFVARIIGNIGDIFFGKLESIFKSLIKHIKNLLNLMQKKWGF